MKTAFRISLALILACFATTATSALTTFSFMGTVTDDPFGLSSFGAAISGTYSFDSAAVDAIADPVSGSYTSTGAGLGFAVTVDGIPFSVSGNLNVGVVNALPDQYLITAIQGPLTLELVLEDASGTALSTDALPVTPPAIAQFAFRQFRLFAPSAEFAGTVDTLGVVPEPETVLLLIVGWASVVLRQWHPRRRRREGNGI